MPIRFRMSNVTFHSLLRDGNNLYCCDAFGIFVTTFSIASYEWNESSTLINFNSFFTSPTKRNVMNRNERNVEWTFCDSSCALFNFLSELQFYVWDVCMLLEKFAHSYLSELKTNFWAILKHSNSLICDTNFSKFNLLLYWEKLSLRREKLMECRIEKLQK